MNQEKRKRVRYFTIALLFLPIWIGVGYLLIRNLDQPYRAFLAPWLGAMAGGPITYLALRAFKPRYLEKSSGDDSQTSGDDS